MGFNGSHRNVIKSVASSRVCKINFLQPQRVGKEALPPPCAQCRLDTPVKALCRGVSHPWSCPAFFYGFLWFWLNWLQFFFVTTAIFTRYNCNTMNTMIGLLTLMLFTIARSVCQFWYIDQPCQNWSLQTPQSSNIFCKKGNVNSKRSYWSRQGKETICEFTFPDSSRFSCISSRRLVAVDCCAGGPSSFLLLPDALLKLDVFRVIRWLSPLTLGIVFQGCQERWDFADGRLQL